VPTSSRDETRGLTLVALSTVAYGIMPVLGKVAYGAGVAVMPLLAWRYVVAALLIAALERGPRPPLRERLRLWAIGSVFVLNSIAYFRALEAIPASVTALVLYTYPVIALLAAVGGVERLTGRGSSPRSPRSPAARSPPAAPRPRRRCLLPAWPGPWRRLSSMPPTSS
jgi:drug/metabolite transporter (DMT)-like permease